MEVSFRNGAGRVVLTMLAVAAAVFALDALLFRYLYGSIRDPFSAAGSVDSAIWNETHRKVTNRNQVLAVGNSRMHLMPRLANELTATTGYTFASIAIGGTTPRGWYYMLRDADPTARRYAAVLIPMETYDDQDPLGDIANWDLDLYYMIGRFRLSDLFDYSFSVHDPALRREAFLGLLLKGTVSKRDFQEFLRDPEKRLDNIRRVRAQSAGWVYRYVGPNASLKGLEIDYKTNAVHYPDGLPEEKRRVIRELLLSPPPPQTGLFGKYLRYWLGRIHERYRGSGTRLIFLHVARAPVVRPALVGFNPHSSVRELGREPDCIVLNEHLFDELEHPELFVDAQHLNWEGSKRFSRILALEVRRVLGPPGTSH